MPRRSAVARVTARPEAAFRAQHAKGPTPRGAGRGRPAAGASPPCRAYAILSGLSALLNADRWRVSPRSHWHLESPSQSPARPSCSLFIWQLLIIRLRGVILTVREAKPGLTGGSSALVPDTRRSVVVPDGRMTHGDHHWFAVHHLGRRGHRRSRTTRRDDRAVNVRRSGLGGRPLGGGTGGCRRRAH